MNVCGHCLWNTIIKKIKGMIILINNKRIGKIRSNFTYNSKLFLYIQLCPLQLYTFKYDFLFVLYWLTGTSAGDKC